MNSTSSSSVEEVSVSLGGSHFYQKAAGMFLAAGSITTLAEAQVVFWSGAGVRDTGNLAPSGAVVSLALEIGTTGASTAYGFVKGVGNLTLPGGALDGFFRGAGAPTVGPANLASFDSPNGKTEVKFFQTNIGATNNATLSGDNFFAFTFTSSEVNGGNAVYGWAQISVPATDTLDNAVITAWAYDSNGGALQLGSTVAAIPEPSGIALLAAGAAGGVAWFHRTRRRRRNAETTAT